MICQIPDFSAGGYWLALFLTGLVGSLTHCAGMCGLFALSCGQGRLTTSPAYHAGRILTYSLLGLAAHAASSHAIAFLKLSWVPSLFLAAGGVLMLMQCLNIGPRLSVPVPSAFHHRFLAYALRQSGNSAQFLAGIAFGFLPCGLLYSVILIAAAARSSVEAFAGMVIFGLATIPVFTIMGSAASRLFQAKPHWVPAIKKGLLAASSLMLFVLAGVRLS